MGYLCLLSNTYYESNKNNKMQSSSNRNIKRKLFYFSSFWPHPIPAYRWKSQLVVCSCWGWRCASLSPTLCFSLFYFSVCVCGWVQSSIKQTINITIKSKMRYKQKHQWNFFWPNIEAHKHTHTSTCSTHEKRLHFEVETKMHERHNKFN